MKTARERFSLGDRVTMTADGREQILSTRPGPKNMNVGGTVRGFSRKADCVRIQRDGAKVIEAYHITFWQRETGG